MDNAISPGLVSDAMDLELKDATVSQLDLARSDPLQDESTAPASNWMRGWD